MSFVQLERIIIWVLKGPDEKWSENNWQNDVVFVNTFKTKFALFQSLGASILSGCHRVAAD